jgi:CheY-like chemotaxis protein
MESIGQLAGGLAHDFNNVLSVIIGFASLLQMKLKMPEAEARMMDNILTAAKKASNLTHSLLAFSRKQIMIKRTQNLNSIVANVGKLLTNLIGEDIQLKINLNDDPLPVFADSGQIEQVLLNMSTNARDAMPHGGMLAITTKLENIDEHFVKAHGFCEPGMYAVITVSDTGKCMDAETRKKIFEPFFTTKETGKGTGLGLAMVYGIIKQHNGYINVYSEPEFGTTFQMFIPSAASCEEHDHETLISNTPPSGSETILIAEDEAPVRELMENILTHFGYKVIMATNGADAIEKFREHQDQIQLVILDMIMPQKSGKIVYEEITQMNPDIRGFSAAVTPLILSSARVIWNTVSNS